VSAGRYFLRETARTGIIRAVRRGTLGLLLLVILALPFPAAAWVDLNHAYHGAPYPHGPQPPLRRGEGEQDRTFSPLLAGDDVGEADIRAAQRSGVRSIAAQADDRLPTLERLLATPRPPRDPVALASRLAGAQVPWTATQPFAAPLQAGRNDTFYVLDQTDNQYKTRPSTLRLVSEHAYWYVEDGQRAADQDIATAARQFDQVTVPAVRRAFGTEWMPGIDGDPRVTIFLGRVPGPAAYFSSWDEYPRSVYRYSNEREMIHVNLVSASLTSADFQGTLAHELQHMIHWHLNPQSDTWLDEGFAQLASQVAVPGSPPGTGSIQRRPDTQLTTWSQDSQMGTHYAASYLFARYFAQRFGEGAIGQFLSEKARAPESITAYLSRAGQGVTFDDVFEDWIVANLLDDPAVRDGRYSHDGIEHRAPVSLALSPNGQPSDQTVQQYGAKYVELTGTGGDAELTFQGAESVRLVGTSATSGRGLWWSNRADGLDSSLTRRFDLTGATSATLRFNLWFDTEADFDFFYVLVSDDGGARWQVLHGANADDANPTGNAIGPGYSGKSGVGSGRGGEPAWIAETVDLTPFAGREVLVRFEYVTDQGYNARGALVDDVEVPEIAFRDDAEADGDWTADGFLRSSNEIPQSWSVQLVEYPRGGSPQIRALRTDASGRIVERIGSLGGQTERAVLVVSGLAPRTIEAASFQVTLRTAP